VLNANNNSRLCHLNNEINGLFPPVVSSHNKYTDDQKMMRKNWENSAISRLKYAVAHWDKTDPNIHKFLKDFSKIS
jgi:hypothetical protein